MCHRLLFSRGICRGEWREWSPVKKMALFEHREFVVFRDVVNGRSKPDSYRARSRHDRFFCFSFFRENKEKGVVDKVSIKLVNL